MNWTQSPSLGIQVAWQEGAPDGSWNLLAPDKITIRDLKPGTIYSVKAQICDHEGKYVEEGQCGPWSDAYPVVSRDEQPLAPTCVLSEGETGHEDNEYDYLGGGYRTNAPYPARVEFTNPQSEWEYGVRIRWSGTDRVEMVVSSDGRWKIRFGQHSADKVVASGAVDNLNVAEGETNDIQFAFRLAHAYSGGYIPGSARFAINDKMYGIEALPQELRGLNQHVNHWVDAISSVRRTKYTQLGTGRSCDE